MYKLHNYDLEVFNNSRVFYYIVSVLTLPEPQLFVKTATIGAWLQEWLLMMR